MPAAEPAELTALRERATTLADLERVQGLLFWDQNTMMPPRGAVARGDQLATLQTIHHERLIDPALGRLLDVLAPWAADRDPDDDAVRLLAELRRDVEKAVRVPTTLAADISRAAALGQAAWQEARASGEFATFRDALARQIELRHRYVECFPGHEHPYDALLDDFEPGMTVAHIRRLFGELREALVPIVAEAAEPGRPAYDGVFTGTYEPEAQRRAVMEILEVVGFDPDGWRLDEAPHPFAAGIAHGDVRITTRYDLHNVAFALFSSLHEFGHGLYEANIPPALQRSPLGMPVSLGIHESQSRLWENIVARGRPFCTWALPRLGRRLPGLAQLEPDVFFRGVNAVRPSLIRTEADETTYNLHIALRFELELAMIEGRVGVDELPAAWNQGMHDMLGVDVPSDAEGVLQDIHWGAGLIGYFPTYTLGNLMAAQLWEAIRTDVPDVEERIGVGDFEPLRTWLHDTIHVHGRKLPPGELLMRATGRELETAPFLAYLRAKLADAGIIAA
jgi:carboxypeptidase Taq